MARDDERPPPFDKYIDEILENYGERYEGNVWAVQGNPVIYHKTLERIAVKAKIKFDAPIILRSERDEAVMMVRGEMIAGEQMKAEWSIGEAVVNVNYSIKGKMKAFVYAMAEKRAKDRVILKLIELHGHVYSEDEDDDFNSQRRQIERENKGEANVRDREDFKAEAELKKQIDTRMNADDLSAFMSSTAYNEAVRSLPDVSKDVVRKHAIKRYRALKSEITGQPSTQEPLDDDPL